MKLVECVPNVSEGRDPATVEAIAAAVRATPGVILLGVSSDPDHNRSVISYLGEPEAALVASVALCLAAFARIDMREHNGCHPRLGAVDVVPFVPLRGVTTEEVVTLARRFGERLGDEGIPVYYYEDAALLPERRNLADVRRGEYEGLRQRLTTEGGRPDAGPSTFNARTGACIVGVRKPLIAFNVNLATDRLEVAQAIARAVRLSSGGYRGVKALGLALPAKGQVQVSMNLVDYESTPIHRVVETIRFEAARFGVSISECELVGLAPLAALEETIRYYLQLHEFSADQIIETHLLGS